jgi:hypothetical protein
MLSIFPTDSVVGLQKSKNDVLEKVLAGLSPLEKQSLDTASKIIIPQSSEVKVPIADASRTTLTGNAIVLLNMHHFSLFCYHKLVNSRFCGAVQKSTTFI